MVWLSKGLRRLRIGWALGCVTAGLACGASSAALAANVTVNPAADTFVAAGDPTSNYGGAGALELSDPTRSLGEYQSLMRFDLAAAKSSFDAAFGAGQWTIQSATLKLSTGNPNNPIFSPNLAGPFTIRWTQNDSWVEGTGTPGSPANDGVTFQTLPSFLSVQDEPLGTFNFPGGTTGANTYALALSPGLLGDVQSGGPLSLRLFADTGQVVSYNFSSRSFTQTANRPVLTLSATGVPEPGTAAVLVCGLLGMGSLRRRRL